MIPIFFVIRESPNHHHHHHHSPTHIKNSIPIMDVIKTISLSHSWFTLNYIYLEDSYWCEIFEIPCISMSHVFPLVWCKVIRDSGEEQWTFLNEIAPSCTSLNHAPMLSPMKEFNNMLVLSHNLSWNIIFSSDHFSPSSIIFLWAPCCHHSFSSNLPSNTPYKNYTLIFRKETSPKRIYDSLF